MEFIAERPPYVVLMRVVQRTSGISTDRPVEGCRAEDGGIRSVVRSWNQLRATEAGLWSATARQEYGGVTETRFRTRLIVACRHG
jgi:hypothetical protein